jgi:hypothetical protein
MTIVQLAREKVYCVLQVAEIITAHARDVKVLAETLNPHLSIHAAPVVVTVSCNSSKCGFIIEIPVYTFGLYVSISSNPAFGEKINITAHRIQSLNHLAYLVKLRALSPPQ